MIEPQWFEFVNAGLDADMFKTDISNYIHEDENQTDYLRLIKEKIEEVIKSSSTKEIGDLGEALIIGHEKVRVKEGGREDLLHLIKKIPTSFALGYDIQSVELDQGKRFIEVKTTVSNKPINFYSFHMTPNEWDTARLHARPVFRLQTDDIKKRNGLIHTARPGRIIQKRQDKDDSKKRRGD